MLIIIVQYEGHQSQWKISRSVQIRQACELDSFWYFQRDSAQFWTATHKILMKVFILKKIKEDTTFVSSQKLTSTVRLCEIAQQETTLLKSVKIGMKPKGQKLIRTTSCAYIVYDPFPGYSLKELLHPDKLTFQKGLAILVQVCQALEKCHQDKIIFFNLDPSNIYVTDSLEILFTDWSLAKMKGSENNSEVVNFLASYSSFVKKNGEVNESTDIYSLGKIFSSVAKSYQNYMTTKSIIHFEALCRKMTLGQVELTEVIQFVKELINSVSSATTNRSLQKVDSLLKSDRLNDRLLKKNASGKKLLRSTNDMKDTVETTDMDSLQSEEKIQRLPKSTSCKNLRGKEETKIKLITKGVLKKRNLSLFLLSLSEFINSQNPILCLVLLKKAFVAGKQAQKENEQLRSVNVTTFYKVKFLLQSQLKKIEKLIAKLRTIDLQFNKNKWLQAEISNFKEMITPQNFNEEIRTFAKSQLSQKSQQKNQSQRAKFLFQVYMLTKSIEFESYESFWDSICKEGNDLEQQLYLQREKKLGLRYFMFKIEEVIRKK